MTYGISYEQFTTIMQALVDKGKLKKQGQLYFAAKAA